MPTSTASTASTASAESRPRVSVVLPVRNGSPHLAAALDSIRRQTERRWELIAVNDGSTDDTGQLLAETARQDPRVRVLTTPPQGIVSALNLGLSSARAPLIARMDADDTSHAERLEQQCDFLENRPELGLVSCLVEFGGHAAAAGGYRRHVTWLNSVVDPDDIRRKRFIESPLAHPSVVFRKSLIAQHGGYRDGCFPEDYDLWLRWLDAGVAMAKVPVTLLTWNDPPGRLSRTCPRYSVHAFYRTKARHVARWLRAVPPGRPVWIWGAGRVTRQRADLLFDEGARAAGWIDIDPKKIGRAHAGLPVRAPDALLQTPRPFVLAYVGSWDARDIISAWLQRHNFREEHDYLLCA